MNKNQIVTTLLKQRAEQLAGDCGGLLRSYMHMLSLNPTYDIPSLKAILVRMGEWEGFVKWHLAEVYKTMNHQWTYDNIPYVLTPEDYDEVHADILTDTDLFIDAVIEYLKEVV